MNTFLFYIFYDAILWYLIRFESYIHYILYCICSLQMFHVPDKCIAPQEAYSPHSVHQDPPYRVCGCSDVPGNHDLGAVCSLVVEQIN